MGRNFKSIKTWQLAHQLALEVYQLTKKFPSEEKYAVTSQLRRSSVSVACNIAEGAGRHSAKEFISFMYIAQGSLTETEYLLYLSRQLGYMSTAGYEQVDQRRIECAKTLSGFIAFLSKNQVLT